MPHQVACHLLSRILSKMLELREMIEDEVKTPFEPRHEKTNVLVSDMVRHKPGCTATEDS